MFAICHGDSRDCNSNRVHSVCFDGGHVGRGWIFLSKLHDFVHPLDVGIVLHFHNRDSVLVLHAVLVLFAVTLFVDMVSPFVELLLCWCCVVWRVALNWGKTI